MIIHCPVIAAIIAVGSIHHHCCAQPKSCAHHWTNSWVRPRLADDSRECPSLTLRWHSPMLCSRGTPAYSCDFFQLRNGGTLLFVGILPHIAHNSDPLF